MARRKKKLAPVLVGRDRIRAIWDAARPREWLEILREAKPDNKWSLHGDSIMCCCPYHDDHNPSFKISFGYRSAKCFGACNHYVSDIVSLYAKLLGVGYLDALAQLSTKLDLSNVIGDDTTEITEYNNLQEMKKAAVVAMGQVIEEYLRDKPSELAYMRPGLVYLVYGRGLHLNNLVQLPVRVFPKPVHIKKYLDQSHHELFDSYFKKALADNRYFGSILFYYNDSPNTISKFKFRFMEKFAAERLGALSSIPRETARSLCSKDMTQIEDSSSPWQGIFGMHHYNRILGSQVSMAYVTEGEFDALSVMDAQLQENRPTDFMVFAAGGSAGTNIANLREYGIRNVYLVPDTPGKNGDHIAYQWLKSEKNYGSSPEMPAITYRVFTWPLGTKGGDLDDFAHAVDYQVLYKYLYTDREQNFLNPSAWAKRKCDQDLYRVASEFESKKSECDDSEGGQNKLSNLQDEERQRVDETISHWVGCLYYERDKNAFLKAYSLERGVDFTRLNRPGVGPSSENVFMQVATKLQHILEEKYMAIPFYKAQDNSRNGDIPMIWRKRIKDLSRYPTNDSQIDTFMSQCVGEDFTEWAKHALGNANNVITPADCESMLPSQLRYMEVDNVRKLMKVVINRMMAQAKDQDLFEHIGPGVQYKSLGGQEKYVYIVDGKNLYKGTPNPGTGKLMEWQEVNNTVDGSLYFDLTTKNKWSSITGVSDLYEAESIDLKEVYDKLRLVLDAWLFEDDEIMKKYLACWIMSVPVQSAMGQATITYITGESTSGKTSLVRGLLGGSKNVGHPVRPIIEGARSITDATPAAIYQCMSYSNLLLSYDEAEVQEGTTNAQRVADVQKLMFAIPTGNSVIVRGGAEGKITEYVLGGPIVMAAIHPSSDPTFLSRIIMVYTKKDAARQDISLYLAEHFTEEEYADLRHKLTVGELAHIPELHKSMLEIKGKLQKVVEDPTYNATRFISTVSPALAVAEQLGFDVFEMYNELTLANKDRLDTINGQSENDKLLDEVLHSKCITVQNSSGVTVALAPRDLILKGGDALKQLNESGCGVYFMPRKNLIILFWAQALRGALQRSAEFRSKNVSALKEWLSKNKYVIQRVDNDMHNEIVRELGLLDARNSTVYTVVKGEYLLINSSDFISDIDSIEGTPNFEEVPIEIYEKELSELI